MITMFTSIFTLQMQIFTESYMERVQLLKFSDFETLLNQIGFKVTHCFGDFHLNPFDSEKSDRLILIAQKQ